jgi:hypothetical protein
MKIETIAQAKATREQGGEINRRRARSTERRTPPQQREKTMIDKRQGTENRPVQPNSKPSPRNTGPARGDQQPSQRQKANVPFPGNS